MRVIFKDSFAKDIKKIRSKALRERAIAVIEDIERADNLRDIANVKRLTADGPYYRIRLGDYRMGLIMEQDTVTFVRFLHRRDIYRYFP